jgi:hypothetical protein
MKKSSDFPGEVNENLRVRGVTPRSFPKNGPGTTQDNPLGTSRHDILCFHTPNTSFFAGKERQFHPRGSRVKFSRIAGFGGPVFFGTKDRSCIFCAISPAPKLQGFIGIKMPGLPNCAIKREFSVGVGTASTAEFFAPGPPLNSPTVT